MAFTVEDGSGLADANAYITAQEWQDHHVDRGVATANDGTYGTTEIEAAIVNATDYVEKRFGKRFKGWKRSRAQALEWPRTDAYDDDQHTFDDVPLQLKKGVAEYALLVLQLGRNLAPVPGVSFPIIDPETGETSVQGSGFLTRTTEKVDVIEDTKEFDSGNRPMTSSGNITTQQIPEYPQADMWIEELLTNERAVWRG
jgi:hypothetical protein